MTDLQHYAEYRSWRCWLNVAVENVDQSLGVTLELVWQITGMVPRVLLLGSLSDESVPYQRNSIGTPTTRTIVGPSGHTYRQGLARDLSQVVDDTLMKMARGVIAPPALSITDAGSDVDTNETIVRCCADLLGCVKRMPEAAKSQDQFAEVLRQAAARWT